MSLKPVDLTPIPEDTVRVAKAAFPKSNIYIKLRDELREWDKTGARPPFAVPIHRKVFASPDTTGEMLHEGLHSKPASELVITHAPLARSNAFAASSPYVC